MSLEAGRLQRRHGEHTFVTAIGYIPTWPARHRGHPKIHGGLVATPAADRQHRPTNSQVYMAGVMALKAMQP